MRKVAISLFLLFPLSLQAAQIGDIVEVEFWEQWIRFLSFKDAGVRLAMLGTGAIGIGCGVLGSFLVVRERSLFGDTLSHAVLPGIALGFMWNANKDPLALTVGSMLAAGLGAYAVPAITKHTRLKIDTAMGLVLSGFYALGILLFTIIQNKNLASQAGLDSFLFGQAAAISKLDAALMVIVSLASLLFVIFFYRSLLLGSFDKTFGKLSKVNRPIISACFTGIVCLMIVVSLKAVGAILVSALLIIPGATALLLCKRMYRVIILAAGIGLLCAWLGCMGSFMGEHLPTGPFIVLALALFFALTLFFRPIEGILWRLLRKRAKSVH